MKRRSSMPVAAVSAPIEEPFVVGGEGADLGMDPESGASIRRLTSGPMMNHLIYCEQPHTSPDGRRVALIRGRDFTFENDFSLMVAEPDTLSLVRVERSIPRKIAHSSWTEWLYYMTHEGGLRRVSLLTLKKEAMLKDGSLPSDTHLDSITPDGRLLICAEHPDGQDTHIVSYDTRSGERRVLYAHPDDHNNGHLQVQPVDGKLIVMQLMASERSPQRGAAREIGVHVVVTSVDGSNPRTLCIGGRHSAESSGHLAWVTGTDRVGVAVEWDRAGRRHDPRHPQGNLAIAGPGDTQPTFFPAPEHGYYHVSFSRCGRYFVADEFMDFEMDTFGRGNFGPARVAVGNLQTGKHRVLVRDCLCRGLAGGSNWEPVPYFTTDNRYVIYNASPFGTNQVHAAKVPPEFLKSLD